MLCWCLWWRRVQCQYKKKIDNGCTCSMNLPKAFGGYCTIFNTVVIKRFFNKTYLVSIDAFCLTIMSMLIWLDGEVLAPTSLPSHKNCLMASEMLCGLMVLLLLGWPWGYLIFYVYLCHLPPGLLMTGVMLQNSKQDIELLGALKKCWFQKLTFAMLSQCVLPEYVHTSPNVATAYFISLKVFVEGAYPP